MKILATATFVLALTSSFVHCWNDDARDYKKINACVARTGRKDFEIRQTIVRNEGCVAECVMRDGIMSTVFEEYKAPCGDDPDNYHCVMDNCVRKDEEVGEKFSQYYLPEIKILDAFVPDLDQTPGTFQSDSFVLVQLIGSNNYIKNDQAEHLCSTHIVSDNLKPIWNFSCKPGPMRESSRLRFIIYDSDSPTSSPEKIGSVTVALKDLTEAGAAGKKFNIITSDGIRSRRHYIRLGASAKNYLQ